MRWVTVIWSIGAGACLTLALIRIVVWWKDQTARANLVFAVLAMSIAAFGAFELGLMRAKTPEQFGLLVRWLHVPLWVMVASVVLFVRFYLRAGWRWLAWTIVGVRTVSLILNFVFWPNLNYREITALEHISFLGESVSVPKGVPNPWMLVAQLSLLLLVIFVLNATITAWRRGDQRQAVMVGGSILFFVVAGSVQGSAIIAWNIPMPVTASLFYQGMVAAMACELSYDMFRVRRDLDERLRLERLAASVGAAFVGLALNRVDEEIENWMQRIVANLDADRIGLFEFTANHAPVRNTHQATSQGVPRLPAEFSYGKLPWYLGELRAGRPVLLSDIAEQLPECAVAERQFAGQHGARAVMGFPLVVSGEI